MVHMSIRQPRQQMAMRLSTLLLLLAVVTTIGSAQGKLQVVTTIPDLEDIARQIGGEKVETFSIAVGYQNPHFVDPKPSYILKLSGADVFLTVGLDLESGWVPPLLNSARNPKILPGGEGYVDASVNVPLLQIPTSVSREQGDIHIYGNPHYWLDPANGKIIARNVRDAFVVARPTDAQYFDENLARFEQAVDARIEVWNSEMDALVGLSIVAYHNQWPYFESAFGLNIVEFLEPKPGIPPTPSQLARVIGLISERDIKVIIISPYYQADAADLVARKTGAQVATLATSVGAFDGIDTYLDLFDYNLNAVKEALEAGRVRQ
jgi:zinc/manganese transport system substrate-binding protein